MKQLTKSRSPSSSDFWNLALWSTCCCCCCKGCCGTCGCGCGGTCGAACCCWLTFCACGGRTCCCAACGGSCPPAMRSSCARRCSSAADSCGCCGAACGVALAAWFSLLASSETAAAVCLFCCSFCSKWSRNAGLSYEIHIRTCQKQQLGWYS